MLKRVEFKLQNKVVIGNAAFNPPFKASDAMHDEARFVHVINGNSKLYVPNQTVALQCTDSLVMKCEKFVNTWYENVNEKPTEIIVIHFYPEVLRYIYDNKVPDLFANVDNPKLKAVEKITINKPLDNFIQSLQSYFENPALLNEELIKLKVRELILILVNSDATGHIKTILANLFKTFEYEFRDIIHSHLFEDLSIEDLAFFAGMSLSSFKRKFNKIFSTSPTRYIREKRLENARILLETTEMRISEIAYECGFNDLGYFSKTFTKEFDNSPSEHRRNHLRQV